MTGAQQEARLDEILALEAAGPALRALPPEAIADRLATAFERLLDPADALGQRALAQLPESSGLTAPMVRWALNDTLGSARAELRSVSQDLQPVSEATRIAVPARLGAIVLAGNVFTACLQPLAVALLARVPVLVKASGEHDVLPRLFHDALVEVDSTLARACRVVQDRAWVSSDLLSRAEVLHVFGGDATIRALRGRWALSAPADARFVAHGHGIGLGYTGRAADVQQAAEAFSTDVAAYDQRGCMSPHAIFVHSSIDAVAFCRALSAALERRERELPRGALPAEDAAAQMQWRGVAQVTGELFAGSAHAVSLDGGASAPRARLSPGWRNISVVRTPSLAAAMRAWARYGGQLKTVGVVGADGLARAIRVRWSRLPRGTSPRVCAAGRMQRPGLRAYSDGLPAWQSWHRFATLSA